MDLPNFFQLSHKYHLSAKPLKISLNLTFNNRNCRKPILRQYVREALNYRQRAFLENEEQEELQQNLQKVIYGKPERI